LIDKRYLEISPVLLQRPSAKKPFAFSYYREMITAYLPDLHLGNLKLPPFPNLQTNMFQFALSEYMPQLPTIPVLSSAQEMVKSRFTNLYHTVVGNQRGKKRKLDEMDSPESPDTSPTAKPERKSNSNEPELLNESTAKSTAESNSSPSTPRRSIRVAVSKKGKDVRESSIPRAVEQEKVPSSSTKSRIMDTLTNMMQSNTVKMESDINDLGERLTKELVEAAMKAQDQMEEEKHERFDYFVEQNLMDNMFHQYMVGLRAHFSYWTDKDIMYLIISHILKE
jgi:hypothetical protein